MVYKLKISAMAHRDIQSIYDYVKKDGQGVAKKQVNYIYDALKKIEYSPNMGKKLGNFIDEETDYIYFVVKKVYIVFYLICESEIHVIRILSARQDYLNILGLS